MSIESPEQFDDLPILRELRDRLQMQLAIDSRRRRYGITRPRRAGGRSRLVTVLALILIASGSAAAAVSLLSSSFPGEPRLPAGSTVLERGIGPDGSSYVIAVSRGDCPNGPSARIELRSQWGFNAGGCGTILNLSLVPGMSFCGGGPQLAHYVGTVSGRVKTVQVLLPGGRSITARVYRLPARIAADAGAFLLFAPRSVEHAREIRSLGASGRVLARAPGTTIRDCFSHRVTTLPPGPATLARGTTPQGTSFAIYLQRIESQHGRVSLCLQQSPQGNGTCLPVEFFHQPHGQCRPRARFCGTPPAWLPAGGEGSCRAPAYQIISGFLLRRGLFAWLTSPRGLHRLPQVGVPMTFHVAGAVAVFYGVVTRAQDRAFVLFRDRRGKTIWSRPAVFPGAVGCAGLNPTGGTTTLAGTPFPPPMTSMP